MATGVHVFTYGSLMFPAVWTRVVAGSYHSVTATLQGFRRQRVRGEDYPSLERMAGEDGRTAKVDGILYLEVAPEDLAELDAFEGADYRRIGAPVIVTEQVPVRGPVAAPAATVQAGAMLPAQTYLFVASSKVEAGEWDPVAFERERIERFLRTYPPARTRRP